jgi:CubicO group peptidase (beta-lactamase class C family)
MKKQALPIKGMLAIILIMVGFGSAAVLGLDNRLEESAKKVDEYLAQWDKNDMPGCAVGAVKDGVLVYKRGFGMANLDYDVPNTPTTRFTVASASKAFTGMSIALLAQQGKLSLDDEIQKYVPEIAKYEYPITIRHLLHHTSGIREYQALIMFAGLSTDSDYSEKFVLNRLAQQKNVSFKPGSKYQYSNSNFVLLGIIVSRVSGKSLRIFADENIFKPLGMKNTLFYDNRFEVVKNRAQGYRVGPDKSIRARSSLDDLVGDGGIMTTVEDLYLWVQNFSEPKVGNKELIKLLTTPGTLNDGGKVNYSFGLFHITYKGLPAIKHSGNQFGFRAQIASFPEQKFASIALCNNMAILPSQIVNKLADIYLEGQFKPEAATQKKPWENLPPAIVLSEKDGARYAGIYAHAETGRVLKLSVKNGKLIESTIFKKEMPVTAISENRILVVDSNGMAELNPIFDKSGTVSEIRILNNGGPTDIFVPVKPPIEAPEKLAEYTGTYHSEEFDADYKISMKGSNLSLYISETLENRLVGLYADAFTLPGGEINLIFTRDEKGKVTGFVFNSGIDDREVKGVIFKRG